MLVFTKLTNGLQVKHWAICEMDFFKNVTSLRGLLTGDGLFACFGLLAFNFMSLCIALHGKPPPCLLSLHWEPRAGISEHSWSLALLRGKLLSSEPNRDKSPLVSGSRMENKVCWNTSLPTRNFYHQSRAEQGRAGQRTSSQSSTVCWWVIKQAGVTLWGGHGTSIGPGVPLHPDVGIMSTAGIQGCDCVFSWQLRGCLDRSSLLCRKDAPTSVPGSHSAVGDTLTPGWWLFGEAGLW